MVQVVTNENMQQFIQTRTVPEFVPPETKKEPEVKQAVATEPKEEQARNADGTFAKAVEDPQVEKQDDPAKKAAQAADEDDDLPIRAKRFIDKKHRQMKEAEEFARQRDREAAVEKARADQLQRELEELRKSGPAQDKPKVKAEGEPNPDDFKTFGEYTDALVEYKFNKRERELEAKRAKDQQESESQRLAREFAERQEQARKEIPDYVEVLSESSISVPGHVLEYVKESELGPKLAYHLAKHPDEATRIAKLSPIRAVAELGKLETKLEKPEKAELPQISKAPSPIRPLDGSTTPVNTDPSKMTFQELRAFREAERRRGR